MRTPPTVTDPADVTAVGLKSDACRGPAAWAAAKTQEPSAMASRMGLFMEAGSCSAACDGTSYVQAARAPHHESLDGGQGIRQPILGPHSRAECGGALAHLGTFRERKPLLEI